MSEGRQLQAILILIDGKPAYAMPDEKGYPAWVRQTAKQVFDLFFDNLKL